MKDLLKNLETILPLLQNKYVEVYIGDTYEELSFSDHSQMVNGVIYGKLLTVIGDFFVLDTFYVDKKDGEVKSGNIIFINSWHIAALSPVDDNGSMADALLSVSHINKIRAIINGK